MQDNDGTNLTPSLYSDDQVIYDAGLGFHATLESLTLVTLKDPGADAVLTTDDISYMGLSLSDLSAELVGIDGLTFGVWDGAVKVNQMTVGTTAAAGSTKIDWSTFTESSDSLVIPTLDVSASVDIYAQGSVALDAFGVLIAKGSFSISLGQVVEDGVPGTTYQAMVLQLGSTA
ncbi:MAG: hypothetical protein P8Z78_13460, partial [Gammaproteobacteria bacterium]